MDAPTDPDPAAFLAAERLARLGDRAAQYTQLGLQVPYPLMEAIRLAGEEWTWRRFNRHIELSA